MSNLVEKAPVKFCLARLVISRNLSLKHPVNHKKIHQNQEKVQRQEKAQRQEKVQIQEKVQRQEKVQKQEKVQRQEKD